MAAMTVSFHFTRWNQRKFESWTKASTNQNTIWTEKDGKRNDEKDYKIDYRSRLKMLSHGKTD